MKKKTPTTANRTGVAVILFIIFVLLVVLFVQSRQMREKNRNFELKKAELTQQIQDEEIRAEELKEMEEQ